MIFQKAERKQVKFKLALTGPSGSGKTYSALLIAAGMGKRIAVVDTENKSAALYAGAAEGPIKGIEFDVLEIESPYTIDKFNAAIDAATEANYDVLIVDSISHAWAGEGGLLDKKAALDMRPNSNSYTNWARITPEQEKFRAKILQSEIHLICTMRSKQDYVLTQNDRGKQVPQKVGMAPIQRDGMEYDFTTVLDLAMDHNAQASKDRTSMFDGQIFKPTRKTGEQIIAWLSGGKPIPKPAAKKESPAQDGPKLKGAPDEFNDGGFDEPDAVPDEFNDGGFDEPDAVPAILSIKPDQLKHIKAGIVALQQRGRSEETIWKGIRKTVIENYNHEFADLNELTDIEAETVHEYLKRWCAHIDEGRASTAARHLAEERAQ